MIQPTETQWKSAQRYLPVRPIDAALAISDGPSMWKVFSSCYSTFTIIDDEGDVIFHDPSEEETRDLHLGD